MNEKVYFGDKQVNYDERQKLVNQVFSSVSSKYDLMNDVMSFGIHRLWKDKMLNEITDFNGSVIDVAGGTGDISLRFYNKAIKQHIKPKLTIFDINKEMLLEGRNKFFDKGIFDGVNYICGNAESISFADSSFDYYTCAFGIRNMTNLDLVLKEAYRILKPGGKFICMEFSHTSNYFFSTAYKIYANTAIPKLGGLITGNQEAYKYLIESIKKFPNQLQFLSMLENNGFKNVKYKNLTGGICAIHTGYKF